MSNEQKKQTIAMFTHVKNEHDFINQWIEYHITLGVNHFYIGIDNSISIQDEYVLHESLKEKVTFFYIEKTKIINQHTVTYKSNQYLKTIKEDWVMISAPDMYYYNHGKNLIDLVNSVKEECGQIIIPNIFLYNVSNSNQDNFLQNINKYKVQHQVIVTHVISRTNGLKNMTDAGHCCILQGNNICKMEDEYTTMPINGNINFQIFHKMKKKINLYKEDINNYKNGIILHFHLRSIDEAFIKDYFQWDAEYKINDRINLFKKMIKCKDFNFTNILESALKTYNMRPQHIKRCRELLHIKNINYFKQPLNIPSLKLKNETKHYDKLINIILKEANISKEEYSEWKKSLIEYLK